MKLGHVALDGTKVPANASKHKAMSYQRMKEKEAQLAAEVEELLRRGQEVDEEEDRRCGKDKRGDKLPEELAFREGRLEKIREAMAALEAEAEAQAEQAAEEGKVHPGVPEDKAQRNFTDSQSRIMPGPGGRNFLQAYNCHAVVDHEHRVIIAARATNQGSDKQQAVTMLEEAIANLGAVPKRCPPTRGITRRRRWPICKSWGWTRSSRRRKPATATGRRRRPKDASPKALSPKDRMLRNSCRPNRVAGDTRCGWRRRSRCSVRSSRAEGSGSSCCVVWTRCSGEWSLICTGHNLLKLFRNCRPIANSGSPLPSAA